MTTRAGTRASRISISRTVPGSASPGATYAIAIGTPSVGDCVPLVTTPGPAVAGPDRVAVAGDPAALDDQADEARGRTVPGDLLERGAADEVAGLAELDDPSEAGLVRVGVEVELVAVQRHARLEPERVARAEADRQPAVRRATAASRASHSAHGPGRCRRRPRSRPRRCSRSARRGPGSRRPSPRPRRSSGARRGRRRSAGRGPRRRADPGPPAGRSPATDRRGPPRKPVSRSASASDTTPALPALATTRNRSRRGGRRSGRRRSRRRARNHRVVRPPDGQARRVRDEGRGQGEAGLRALDVELAHVRQVEQPDRRSRTVRCSSMIEPYWTGISQPLNSIRRAPSASVRVVQRGQVDRRIGRVGHERPLGGRSRPRLDRRRARPAGRRRARRAPARSRRSASWPPNRTGSSGPRRTRGRARRGRRRPAPSGSSGRSCGCACPDWTNQYSIESSGPVMLDLEAGLLLDLAEGGLLARLAGMGRALGQRPGPAVALTPAAADDEPGLALLVANDDPAGGGGGRGPQAGHGADAAPGRRAVPGRPDLAHSMVTVGRGRPLARSPATTAGWMARQLARRRVSGATSGPRSTVERTPGAWNDPDGRRPRRRSRTRVDGRTKSGRRAGRVLGRDAVIHGRLWYRFRAALQGRVEHDHASSPRPPVPARHAPRPDRSRGAAAATYRSRTPGGVRAQGLEVGRPASRRRRGSSARSGRPGSRAPGRCRGSPR